MTSLVSDRSNDPGSFDIVVVGGGVGGTLAATLLGRAGYTVCLIDYHAVYPPDFRAEHLDGPQIGQLRRLGFLDDLTLGLYRGETVTLARAGRIVGTSGTINYGLRYEDLVNRARAALPPEVRTVIGRVAQVDTSDTIQRVRLSDGGMITGRLVVLATGQGQAIGKALGIGRRLIRQAHSLTFGFDIEPIGDTCFEHSFLVYQREQIRDRIDYLAAFTMGATTRVNLFTYRDYKEPWTRAFMADPAAGLRGTLPGLASVMGAYRPTGPVVGRPIDLYTSERHRRDGVVMIGDAFQAACPATGMGMVRLLTDVEQLTALHIPRWLRTPGMNAAKIGSFYDDPVKRSCDEKALHDSEYRRALSTEQRPIWRLHRGRIRTMQTMARWWHRQPALSYPRISADPPGDMAGDPARA
ncbi:FAD-dependent oxidoreductase [Rhodopila sp.]|uniref:FAD-dependent oxidoreductase n=1 Tax=Rhodopila sp. TaxID=2480087 RepID=UPI003D1239C7